MWLKMKYRSQIYNINRYRTRHGYKYTKYKMYLTVMKRISIKQHLTNIRSSIMKKFSNTESELKKSVANNKRACVLRHSRNLEEVKKLKLFHKIYAKRYYKIRTMKISKMMK